MAREACRGSISSSMLVEDSGRSKAGLDCATCMVFARRTYLCSLSSALNDRDGTSCAAVVRRSMNESAAISPHRRVLHYCSRFLRRKTKAEREGKFENSAPARIIFWLGGAGDTLYPKVAI